MDVRQQQFQDMINSSDPTVKYVYFLLAVDGNNSTVKIGSTSKIEDYITGRLKQLQVGNPNRLILIGFLRGRETYYQIKFEEDWIRGEWFNFHNIKDRLLELDLELLDHEIKHYSYQCVKDFARNWKSKYYINDKNTQEKVREVILDLVRTHNINSPGYDKKGFIKYLLDFKMNHYGNSTTKEVMVEEGLYNSPRNRGKK